MSTPVLPEAAAVAALTAELVAIPSANAAGADRCEAAMGAFVADYLGRLGAEVSSQEVLPGRCNIIGRLPGGGGPTLVLLSHMDTVSGEGWRDGDPCTPRIAGDRLYGRGACDTKGSLAAMLLAMALLARAPRSGDVLLAATVDEESQMRGAHYLVQSGLQADAAIVGEPTAMQVGVAHNGVIRWEVDVHGVAVHSSRPEHGVNAIYGMAALVAFIRDHMVPAAVARVHPLTGAAATSVTLVRGGQMPNVVPDCCTITVERRLLPGEDARRTWQAYGAALQQALSAWPDHTLTVSEPFYVSSALDTPADAAVVRSLQHGCMELGTAPPTPMGFPFGTEAGVLSRSGIPSVIFGPGDIAQAHTADEFVNLSRVRMAAGILHTAARRFTTGHAGS